jgi:hypothetical protein
MKKIAKIYMATAIALVAIAVACGQLWALGALIGGLVYNQPAPDVVCTQREKKTTTTAETLSTTVDVPDNAYCMIADFYYTVTDAGIEAGENAQGMVNVLEAKRKGDQYPSIFCTRDSLQAAAYASAHTYFGHDSLPHTPFEDDTPTTTEAENAFYMFYGKFAAGKWEMKLDLLATTDEFGAASVLSFEFAMQVLTCGSVGGGLTAIRGDTIKTAPKLSPKGKPVGLYIIETLSGISQVNLGGKAMTSTELEVTKRLYNMQAGNIYNDTLPTAALFFNLGEGMPISLTFSADKTSAWGAVYRSSGKTKSGKKRRSGKSRRRKKSRRRPRARREMAESYRV